MAVALYRQCDNGMAGMRYPDGGALLDQPSVLMSAFAIISHQFYEYRKKK